MGTRSGKFRRSTRTVRMLLGVAVAAALIGVVSPVVGAEGTEEESLAPASSPFVVDFSASPAVAEPDEEVTYTVRLSTASPGGATVRRLTDSWWGDIAWAGNPDLVSTTCAVPISLSSQGAVVECRYVVLAEGAPGSTRAYGLTVSDEEGGITNAAVSVAIAGPAVAITKAFEDILVDADGSGSVTPGDVIAFSIVVENEGNVPLTDVEVTDELEGATIDACDGFGEGSLAPGATGVCIATYEVSTADGQAGEVVNVATVATAQTEPRSSEVRVEVGPARPAMTLTVASQPPGGRVGDTLTFTMVLTNTGPVTLTDVAVSEPRSGLAETVPSLAPGAQQIYTRAYTLTAGDLTPGGTFTVTATAVDDEAGTVQAQVVVAVAAAATPEQPPPPRIPTVQTSTLPVTGAPSVRVLSFAVSILAAGAALFVWGTGLRRPVRPDGADGRPAG